MDYDGHVVDVARLGRQLIHVAEPVNKTVINKKLCYRRRWLGSRVVSVLDSGAEGPGTNRSRDAVG